MSPSVAKRLTGFQHVVNPCLFAFAPFAGLRRNQALDVTVSCEAAYRFSACGPLPFRLRAVCGASAESGFSCHRQLRSGLPVFSMWSILACSPSRRLRGLRRNQALDVTVSCEAAYPFSACGPLPFRLPPFFQALVVTVSRFSACGQSLPVRLRAVCGASAESGFSCHRQLRSGLPVFSMWSLAFSPSRHLRGFGGIRL
jgi:hypothetical protein